MSFDMTSAVDIKQDAIQTTSFDPSSAEDTVTPKPQKNPSPVDMFLRNIFKNSPIEQLQTEQARLNIYAGVKEGDSDEVRANKIHESLKNPPIDVSSSQVMDMLNTGKPIHQQTPEEISKDAQVEQGMQQREKDIASQGIGRQVEAPMTAALSAGAVVAPISTALGIGAYTLKDHFFDGRRWIEENHPNAPPLVKDAVEALDFVGTMGLMGLGSVGKDYFMNRTKELNLPKALAIDPQQIEQAKGTSTLDKLGIDKEHVDASIASQIPVQVPTEKVVDLATSGDWNKAKEDLGLLPKKEQQITMGFEENPPEPISENQFVKVPKLGLFLKDDSKTTADEIRARMVGTVDEQKTRMNQWAETGKKQIDNPLEQEGMFWFAGAAGDRGKIVDYMMKMEELPESNPVKEYYDKTLKPQMQSALDLSEKAIDKVKQGSQYYAEAGQVAKDLGSIKTIRENYQSARIYKPEPPEDIVSTGKKRTGITTKHSKERYYDTPFDAVLGGKEFATTNYFDALSLHNEEMSYVNTSRAMLNEMEGLDIGKWVERGETPEGYEQVGDLQKGSKVFVSPEMISKGLRAITEPNNLRKISELTAVGKLNGFVKSFNVALSFFHHHQFIKQTLSSRNGEKILADFVKNISTRKDPFETEDFKNIELEGSKDGLRTTTQQANYDIMKDINKVEGKWLDKLKDQPGIKQVEKLVDANNKLLFDKMQRYFKVMVYGDRVSQWVSKNPEATEQESTEARRGIARAVNNTYGGQNWEMLGIDKTRLGVMRLALFAPDWLMSAILHTKDAAVDFKTPAGQIARANLVKGLLLGTAWTQLLNHLSTGHYTDENRKGHQMEAEIAPNVYMNLYGGATGEFVKFASNIIEDNGMPGAIRYFQGKGAPLTRFASMVLNGRNYQGQKIEDVPFKGKDIATKNINYILNLASSITPLPFSIESKIGAPQDNEKTILGEVATLSGIGRYSAPPKKKKKD